MKAGTPPEASCDLDACRNFQSAWWHNGPQAIERFLPPEDRPNYAATLEELVLLDMELRWKAAGATAPVPLVEDYLARFPGLDQPEAVRRLRQQEDTLRHQHGLAGAAKDYPAQTGPWKSDEPVRSGGDALPQRIGRYRVERILGEGSFGRVYLAHDDQLNRPVAIKVPHRSLVSRPEDAAIYLTEARIVANLDHPNIVAVHDVGGTDDFPCFIVSRYIEGSTLAEKIRDQRPSFGDATELVATVAEALHYAHCKGLVHRDIKPGNILLDKRGKPFVVDFGLALQEEQVGQGAKYAGTPAYMSPEQARGEGHLVDGRSDIFSLGVVFYELLTGRRPFVASESLQLMRRISTTEIRPPRQLDTTIPKELERICLKALAKRASERYTTAFDLADDLQHWLSQSEAVPAELPGAEKLAKGSVKIVPKGLRSFDAQDADFFLELLPGPRDREGLPESIRFWKTRIEENDRDHTFRVGLIYGPSGCGKSSLIKAGLVPRLGDNVVAVYVETTANETEARLLNGLRKGCPLLPVQLGLKETLAALRHGQGIPVGRKVLIVLDQFEQWLHTKKEEENTELVQALRQCDGVRVQCVITVRDDFWMAVTRFLSQLEIELLQGRNCAAADLFDLDHARKVLIAFGRAFGRLPEESHETTQEQQEFMNQAVAGLSQENKIICVRLALFAEMMKGRPWTPATLKEVGGIEGVGVTFLEDTFSSLTANPKHRLHQKASRAVLKALLPEFGTDIKGHMRSHAELLAASGYASRPKEFDDLIRILDSEIRLLTPTDREGKEPEEDSNFQTGEKYYQLTHDYLVHSLRDWLTRKQKETRRGRAELLLADRASVWSGKPENRQLPSLLQWWQIRWLTQEKIWTPPQRKMMRKATRYHALRGLAVALLVALLGGGVYEGRGRLQAHALRGHLLDANTSEVPTIVKDMAPYRRWLDPLLSEVFAQAERDNDRRKQLHARLALLPVDASHVEWLYGQLLDADAQEVPVIRDFLAAHQEDLVDRLWEVSEKPEKGKEQQRLRAAAALASYDPESQLWGRVCEPVANDLVSVPAVHLGAWVELFRPVRRKLLPPLTVVFRDGKRRETERSLATDLLADYAADQPQILADLLMDADEKQFAVLYPKLPAHGGGALAMLQVEVDKKLPPDAKNDVKEKLAKRQANAAVALLRLNVPDKVWPLLQHSPDPRVRSYLIHRFSPLGSDASGLVKRLEKESDVTIRRALVLSLGEFGEEAWPTGERGVVVTRMQDLYRTAEDPGLHAAVEWVLRQPHWRQQEWLRQTNEVWMKDKAMREKRLQEIKQGLAKEKGQAAPRWYVNGQGQTMVVIPGPVEFVMGSPPTEAGRNQYELQHKKRIGRTFALAAKFVTLEQYRKFTARYGVGEIEQWARTGDSPVLATSWFQAAAYCNWLSKQEGLPKSEWCYEPLQDPKALPALAGSSGGVLAGSLGPLLAACGLFPGRTDAEYREGMKLAPNYLRRSGYRLPTEAETEYATRAGAVTSRYYGETEDLLPRYAWYAKNSMERAWPVGSLKPNDLGLFDGHGNVCTWCQEEFKNYPQGQGEKPNEDKEFSLNINLRENRLVRGGQFLDLPMGVRSAARTRLVGSYRNWTVGFRVARTLPTDLYQ